MGLLQRMRTAVGVLKGNPLTEAMYLPWQSGTGVFRPKNYAEMVKAYRSWVYACASVNASSMAKLKLRLYVQKGREKEEIFEHPFLVMLKNINPFMNRFELLELTTIFLELTGNAYWYIAKNQLGTPAEIWLMHSQFVKVVPDKEEFIRGYLWEMYGKKIAFSPEEVVHFKYPNPNSMYYGMGPLEAAAWGVDTNDYMQRYEAALFKNQARPESVLETEQSLNDPEFKRLQRMWVSAHQGVEKSGKTAILEKGLKYKPIQMSPRELGFLTGRKLTREEICAIFGVPLSKLGIVTDVNRANAEANDYTFQKETILPRATRMQEKIDEKILPMYDSKLSSEFENPVPADKEFKLKEKESNLKCLVTSVNEERAREGKEPVPWGKVPIAPINMMPLMSGDIEKEKKTQRHIAIKAQTKDDDSRKRRLQHFQRLMAPRVKRFRDAMKKYFSGQRKEVLANLKKLSGKAKQIVKLGESDIDYILFAEEEAKELLRLAGNPHIEDALGAGILRAVADLGVDIDLDMLNPKVIAWLKTKVFKFSFDITNTTQEGLRATLIEGLQAGESIPKLAERVNTVFDFAETYRAERIARTEVSEAIHRGELMGWQESGVVEKKAWLLGADPCDLCLEQAAPGAINIDQQFPGGVDAPPVHPNCVCDVVPIMKEE